MCLNIAVGGAFNLAGLPIMGVEDHPERNEPVQRTQPAMLLHARRQFLTGSLAVSGFAATLASRPARAGGTYGNWVYQEVAAVCSAHASQTITPPSTSGCHVDFYTCNKSNWGGWDYKTQKFSGCGWTPPATCGFSDGVLWNYISACYSGSQWSGYSYNGSASQNTVNACWIACGFINAKCNPTGFGMSYTDFANACHTAFSTPNCDGQLIATQLCSFLKQHCTQNYVGTIRHSNYSNWCWN
jgi:hypothetical protein